MRLFDAVKAAASGVEDDGSYDSPHSAENSAARRAAAFKVTADDLGPGDWSSKPFGVIIETSGPRGLSTLAAFANGDASLLHENGSGIIGRQNHVHVVKQAKKLVAIAADLVPLLRPADTVSKPGPGAVRFYFLTDEGLLSTEIMLQDLRSGESPLSPLMEVADELVSEFRQYLLPDMVPAKPPGLVAHARSLAMVAVIGGLTYAAWLIPIAWIRWPLVAIGLFFTAAAVFVFYLLLAGGPDDVDEEAAAAR